MNTTEAHTKANSNKEGDENDWLYAMQLASSSVLPMVLKSAIELGVLEIIGKAGPGALLSPSQISSQLPTNNPDAPLLLDRVLRLLCSYSILTCSQDDDGRLYGLAPVAKYFLPNEDEVSLAPLFQVIQDKLMINMWYHMKDAVLDGGLPFNRAYGMNAIDYVQKEASFFELFKTSMRDYNSMFMKKVLEIYKGFEGLTSLVDVGGRDGTVLNMIRSKYPTIKAINFDLAQVMEKSLLYPGIEHIAGDMFDTIPKGDAIFMKWMLHGWDDEQCVKILKNCYQALPNDGKAIIVDLVVPEVPESSVAIKSLLQFDLYMMNMNPGGKERTEREFRSLATAAGFSGMRVTCRAFNFSLIEFYKSC